MNRRDHDNFHGVEVATTTCHHSGTSGMVRPAGGSEEKPEGHYGGERHRLYCISRSVLRQSAPKFCCLPAMLSMIATNVWATVLAGVGHLQASYMQFQKFHRCSEDFRGTVESGIALHRTVERSCPVAGGFDPVKGRTIVENSGQISSYGKSMATAPSLLTVTNLSSLTKKCPLKASKTMRPPGS